MIAFSMKSHTPRPRFRTSAARPRPQPIRQSGLRAPATPSDTAAPADATYLRRWIAHQATTYNNLLETIAAAPAPHGKRDQ